MNSSMVSMNDKETTMPILGTSETSTSINVVKNTLKDSVQSKKYDPAIVYTVENTYG